MRAGGGKQKGAGFERLVCKHLSLWITSGAKEDCFWRSAMSGGRGTLLNRKGKAAGNSAGDITATGEEGHALTDNFFIECKAYRTLSVDSFVLKNSGALWKFWATATSEALKHGKAPMLIAKQNGVDPFVLARDRDIVKFFDMGTTFPFLSLGPAHVSLWWFKSLFPLPRNKPTTRKK